MLNKLKMLLIAGFALAPLAVPAVSVAQANTNAACAGASLDAGSLVGGNANDAACADDPNNSRSITDLIATIINIFTFVVGAVAVVMIIIAGFKYVVSGGDSGGVSSAKNTIIYAIVGLVVVIFAQVIVRFVLTNIGT